MLRRGALCCFALVALAGAVFLARPFGLPLRPFGVGLQLAGAAVLLLVIVAPSWSADSPFGRHAVRVVTEGLLWQKVGWMLLGTVVIWFDGYWYGSDTPRLRE